MVANGDQLFTGSVVAVAFVSVLFGVVQFAGGGTTLVPVLTPHAPNAPGLFINRNHQATFLLVAMPVLATAVRQSRQWQKIGSFERSASFVVLLAFLASGVAAHGAPARARRDLDQERPAFSATEAPPCRPLRPPLWQHCNTVASLLTIAMKATCLR